MPIRDFPGDISPRTVRADNFCPHCECIMSGSNNIKRWYTLRDADYQFNPRLGSLHHCILYKWCWHKDDRGIGTSLFDSLPYGVKDWNSACVSAPLARRDTCNYICSILLHFGCVKSAIPPGDSLNHNFGIFIYKYAHFSSSLNFKIAIFSPESSNFKPDEQLHDSGRLTQQPF